MNKTISIIIALCACLYTAGAGLVDPYTVFTSETNKAELVKLGVSPGQGQTIQWFIENGATITSKKSFSKSDLISIALRKKGDLLHAVNEEAATDKGFSWNFYVKTATNLWSNFIFEIAKTNQRKAALYDKYKTVDPSRYSAQDAVDYISVVGLARGTALDEIRKAIVREYTRQVKVHLRDIGKSFVTTDDGTNPMETYLKTIETSLNSPYWNGLEKAFSDIGVQITFDRSSFPTGQDLEEYLDKVLIDDLNIKNAVVGNTLKFCLGSEEYNKFVNKYNYGENGPPSTNE